MNGRPVPGAPAALIPSPDALESLELIEELVELQAESAEPLPDSPLLGLACIRSLVASYGQMPTPVAILDGNLSFVFRNAAFNALMRSFQYPEHASLLSAFARAFDSDSLKELYHAIRDPATGSSWNGSIRHHARDSASVLTKAHIVPFMPEGGEQAPPVAWVVFLDDVTEEHKRFLRGMFSSLLEASKLKDNDTGRHIERVNLYSHRMAIKMYGDPRWPEVDLDFVENIGFLAAMHDVGKIGTPDDILNKQGPLNEFEWAIMKEHTINGAFILSSYPNPMAKQIAQSHHEWWNGSGYPFRLVGEMIPLPARIVSLADVYDALRMRRSYKSSFDHKRASLLIMADGGSHFDPEIVELFSGVGDEFERIYSEHQDA